MANRALVALVLSVVLCASTCCVAQAQKAHSMHPSTLKLPNSGALSCEGRRVYMVDMGSQFHRDLLYGKDEKGAFGRGTGVNGGFGIEKRSSLHSRDPSAVLRGVSSTNSNSPPIGEDHYSDTSSATANSSSSEFDTWPKLSGTWHDTWANSLDVVFHSRMVNYPCLTTSPEEADLVYIVYYGSLDISRHLGKNSLQRGRLGREMAALLSQQSRFNRHGGKDHFLVVGRPVWDFISNISDPYNPWGTDFLNSPVMKPVKVVTVEASVWNPFTIGGPYTTSFHPPSRKELHQWRSFVESHERPNLFAFGGAVRRGAKHASIQRAGAIRERVFWQCGQSSKCRLLDCENPPRACEKDWRIFTQLYLSSTFCIHPPGDSCTRRAVLDGMLAGCIPLVLEKCTVEHQYQWLLGKAENFSVFIDGESLKGPPETDPQGAEGTSAIKKGDVLIEDVLAAIPKRKVMAMRKLVLDFIPKITFGGKANDQGTIDPPNYADAFDSIVKHLLRTVRDALAEQ